MRKATFTTLMEKQVYYKDQALWKEQSQDFYARLSKIVPGPTIVADDLLNGEPFRVWLFYDEPNVAACKAHIWANAIEILADPAWEHA